MKARKYWIPAGISAVLGLFFRFGLVGYGFLGLCFLALAVLILVFMGLGLLARRHEKTAKRLKTALFIVLSVFFLAAAATEGYVVSKAADDSGGEKYAVVLGAGVNGTTPSLSLHRRLEAASEYLRENPDAVLILSGGQGPGEDISEAQCMFNWLTQRGADPERLLLEDRSTSTRENLTFTREILLSQGAGGEKVCVITAGYHLARAELMAEDLGYGDVSAKAAPAGYPLLELNYYLREIPALWWYLLTR